MIVEGECCGVLYSVAELCCSGSLLSAVGFADTCGDASICPHVFRR